MSDAVEKRNALVQSLKRRLERWVVYGDCRAVLDDAAVAEADALIRVIGNSPLDLEVQRSVADVRWTRYQLAAAGDQQAAFEAERVAAISHFSAVHMSEPKAVPPEVREVLEDLLRSTNQASTLMDRAAGPGGLAALAFIASDRIPASQAAGSVGRSVCL